MDTAGHDSRQMLARYNHIRMEAKRKALEGIATKPVAKKEEFLERSGLGVCPRNWRRARTDKILAPWGKDWVHGLLHGTEDAFSLVLSTHLGLRR